MCVFQTYVREADRQVTERLCELALWSVRIGSRMVEAIAGGLREGLLDMSVLFL